MAVDHTVVFSASSDKPGEIYESRTYYKDVADPRRLPDPAFCPETIKEWADWHREIAGKIRPKRKRLARLAEIERLSDVAIQEWWRANKLRAWR